MPFLVNLKLLNCPVKKNSTVLSGIRPQYYENAIVDHNRSASPSQYFVPVPCLLWTHKHALRQQPVSTEHGNKYSELNRISSPARSGPLHPGFCSRWGCNRSDSLATHCRYGRVVKSASIITCSNSITRSSSSWALCCTLGFLISLAIAHSTEIVVVSIPAVIVSCKNHSI